MAPINYLNTSDLAEKARRELLRLLEAVRGKKNLVIEKELAGPINIFVKFSTLQEYGVDRVFFLENDNIDASQRNIVFLVRSEELSQVEAVAKQIKRIRDTSSSEHEFSIFWAPRRTLVSDQILEEAAVLGEANISEFPLYFIPLAEDVLSLELADSFGDLYLRRDPTPIFKSAKALMLLQQKHGLFPRIFAKGDNARRLTDLLLRMRSELSAGDDAGISSIELSPSQSLETLIVIDREVDFPTALLTQLTYEGLIDEDFGISSNQVDLDTNIVGAPPQAAQGSSSAAAAGAQTSALKRKVILDNSDSLYTSLRDANCAVIGPMLNKVARRLQSTLDSRVTAKDSTAELRAFVAKLPGLQAEQVSLKLHTNLAEEIIKRTRSDIFTRILEIQQNIAAGADPASQHDNIEELISRAVPIEKILRCICLESTMSNGLKARDMETFKRAVIHAYGHQHLLTLSRLEKMGLLEQRAGALSSVGVGSSSATPANYTNYVQARKNLHLIFDEVNESEPDDIAYVFSGYAPLSVRLVQCILQKQYLAGLTMPRGGAVGSTVGAGQAWRPFEDAVKAVRGATVYETQSGDDKAIRARQMLNGSNGGAAADKEKTIVVFFLGGVTRAEISALRFVQKQMAEQGTQRRIVVACTSVITGDRMMEAAVETRSFEMPVAVGVDGQT